MNLAHVAWTAVGRPSPSVAAARRMAAAHCAICGEPAESAVPTSKGVKDSFSDHRDLVLPASEWCCAACVWSMEGKPPNTWRMWSVLWREDGETPESRGPWGAPGLYLTNKAETRPLLATLLSPPPCRWAMAVADSGQIHTMIFAPVNLASQRQWQVRYERVDVRSSAAETSALHAHVSALLAAGYAKRDILGGDPQSSSLRKHGIEVWREHGAALRRWAGAPILALIVALTPKEAT